MSKKEEMDIQNLLNELKALKAEKEQLALELQQKAKGGRAIDEFALHQTDLILENNVTKLFSIYMMLSLVFEEESYQSQVENYIHKMKLSNKLPTLKTISSLIARVSKSLNLTKKQDEETLDIKFKNLPLITEQKDTGDCPL